MDHRLELDVAELNMASDRIVRLRMQHGSTVDFLDLRVTNGKLTLRTGGGCIVLRPMGPNVVRVSVEDDYGHRWPEADEPLGIAGDGPTGSKGGA